VGGWTVVLRGIRYRSGRSLMVLLLAAVATAATVLAPAYARAAQQSVLTDRLADAPANATGLHLSSDPLSGDGPESTVEAKLAVQQLLNRTSTLHRLLGTPTGSADVQATRTETSASADSTMGETTNPQNFGGSKPALAADRTADGARRRPNWGQLLKSGAATDEMEVDVTHVQMLVFTLVTATFVAVKVAVSYEIPEIPDNFLLLMGISNGVYIAGRQVTPAVKNGGAE